MSIQDAAMVIPSHEIDKIVFSSAFNIGGSSTILNVFFADTGIDINDVIPIGIWSDDGGLSWNNCNAPSGGGFNDASVDLYINTSDELYCFASSFGAGSINFPFQLKMALIAKEDMIDMGDSTFSGRGAAYTTANSYMKINTQGTLSVGSGVKSFTIPHSVGDIPMVLLAVSNPSIGIKMKMLPSDFGNAGAINEGARIDENNLYIDTNYGGGGNTIYYRIYEEN